MTRPASALAAVMTLAFGVALAAAPPPGKKPALPAPPPAHAPAPAVVKVADRSLVCMVNDQDMGKTQIPVVVEGKTYYGCCAMCKERLAKDANARTGVDPVSGKITTAQADVVPPPGR